MIKLKLKNLIIDHFVFCTGPWCVKLHPDLRTPEEISEAFSDPST